MNRMLKALGLTTVAQPGSGTSAARYDPTSKQVYLASGSSKFERVVLTAHELTHALQDQYSLLPAALHSTVVDERLFALLLVEGDAVATSATVAMQGGCDRFTLSQVVWRLDQVRKETPKDDIANAVLAEMIYSAGAFVMCQYPPHERDSVLSACKGSSFGIFDYASSGQLAKARLCSGAPAELGALVLFAFLSPANPAKDIWPVLGTIQERAVSVPAGSGSDSWCTWGWDAPTPRDAEAFAAILKKRLQLFPSSSGNSILRNGTQVTLRIQCPLV